MTEMYLGYPPANIEAWISAHYEPTPAPTLTEGGYWKREDGVLFAGGLKDPSHEMPIIWNESDSE